MKLVVQVQVLIALTLVGFLLFITSVEAADLTTLPVDRFYQTGETFTATIGVDPKGEEVSRLSGNIAFDTTKLEVVRIRTNSTDFAHLDLDPTLTDSDVIVFKADNPLPITSSATVFAIEFMALAPGEVWLSANNIAIYNVAGEKVNYLERLINIVYTTIVSADGSEINSSQSASSASNDSVSGNEGESGEVLEPDNSLAMLPIIISAEIPDPGRWYNLTEASFNWLLPEGVVKVATDITDKADHEPLTVHSPPITELALNRQDLVPGIQYLSVQFKDNDGWGEITSYPIKIDTTPPEPFKVSFDESYQKLFFNTADFVSGIERYEIIVADQPPIVITPNQIKVGYRLKGLAPGNHLVAVVARDFAGNERVSTKSILVPAIVTETLVEAEPVPPPPSKVSNIFLFILITIIIVQFTVLYYERRRMQRREVKLRQENREVYNQVRKIFVALRDEVYDQIVNLTKRPKLSKKEKEVVKSLHLALEFSEKLIEKEISDVDKELD